MNEEKEVKDLIDLIKFAGNSTEETSLKLNGIACKTIYEYIETQQKELDKKDKIIDLMAEMITEAKICYFKKEDGGELLGKYRTYTKNEWIEYFTKKTEDK